jgi:alpha-N-arabinofuranosidase
MLLASSLAVATEIHVSPAGNDANPGTVSEMLKTISAAANLAQPGDTVTVHAGTYRERIDPPRGGTSESNRIVYQAAPGEAVTIKGAEIVSGWQFVSNDTWSVTLPAEFFGSFNPFNNLLTGDYFTSNNRNHHSAAVYLNGSWLSAAASQAPVLQPASGTPQWFATVNGGGYLANVRQFQLFAGATAGTTVAASLFARDFGVVNTTASEGGQCVSRIESGDWTRYADVNFGTGTDTIRIRAAAAAGGARIEVRRDGPTGPLLGTCAVTTTGGLQSWQTFTAAITPTSGVHTVCLVYRYPASATGATTIWAQFPGRNPNNELVEVNARQTVFYPEETGVGYLTVRGFTLEQAATPWAPPTAEQIGLIGPNWGKGWIIENNTVRYSRCAGISLGKYGDRWDNTATEFVFDGAGAYVDTINRALENGWNKETVGSHIVRNNHIHHCEQVGVVGSLGCCFSTVTGNTIHACWVQKQFSGYEQAGIKFHGAIDAEIARNHDYGNGGFGIWLDWMTQGTRVTGNLFHNNAQQDLFMEVNHGPFMVDHNLFLSSQALFINSQGGAYAHNLIAGSISLHTADSRQTPYHEAHSTAVAGLHDNPYGDMRFYNNIYVQPGQTTSYNSSTLQSWLSGNVYLKGAAASTKEVSPLVLSSFNPALSVSSGFGGYYLQMTADPAWGTVRNRTLVTTALLGNASISSLPFEQADGTPYSLDTDQLGAPRNTANPFPGPFETVTQGVNVWKVFNDASFTAPTGLTATPGINRVFLNWTSFIGATSYSIKRAATSGGPYTTLATGLTGTTWTDPDVVNGMPYFYVITASDGVNEGALSAEVTATARDFIAVNCGGGASGNFSADAMFSTGVTYTSGTAVSTTGVTNPAPSAVYQSERWGVLNYTVPGLDPGVSYLVRLHFAEIYFNAPGGGSGGVGSRVFNVLVNGNAALSNFDIYAVAGGANKAVVRDITATADGSGQIAIALQTVVSNPKISGFEIYPLTAPQPPAGLTATAGVQQVSLNWSSASGIQGYRVWRSDSLDGTYSVIGTTTNPTFSDLNVASNTVYYYAVSSTNPLGESANSPAVSATPLMPVTAVWINPAGGSWPVGGNWNNGVVANGSNVVADFSTLNLITDSAVTLDGVRTVGGLVFGDTSPSQHWDLIPGSSGPLTLDANFSPFIQVSNSSATLGVVLAGSKGLAKTGTGLLTLTGTNTYTGGTVVHGGTLKLNLTSRSNNTALNLGTLTANSGGTLELHANAAASYGATALFSTGTAFTGAGTITKTGTGIADLWQNSGIKTFTGLIDVQQGVLANQTTSDWSTSAGHMSLNVASGAYFDLRTDSAVIDKLTGSGTIASSYTAGMRLTIGAQNGSSTFGGVIQNVMPVLAGLQNSSGTIVLTKTGTGTLILAGTNTYSGVTAVDGGMLLINGTHAGTGTVSVAAAATLGGTGTLAASVTAGGTLAPGTTGTGTLATGPVNLTGAYACQLDGLTCDRLAVTGGLTLNGATLAVSVITPPTAASYVIASYTGVVPEFTTVTGLPAGYSLDYGTAGQIKLTGSPPYAAWAAHNGLGQTSGGKNMDPDHDGVGNLMEFALGGDPLGAADQGKSLAAMRENAGSQALTFTIAVRASVTFAPGSDNTREATVDDITYRIEASQDLSIWNKAVFEVTPAITTGLPSVPAGYEYHTFTVGPVSSTPADFIRVKVTAP